MKLRPAFLPILLALAELILAAQLSSGANIVGFDNAVFLPGYNLVSNPFDAGNNSVTNIITTSNEIIRVFLWDVPSQSFADFATFDPELGQWDNDFLLPPGKGFVVLSSSRHTNLFFGDVLQGSLSNFVAGGNSLSLLGSKAALTGGLSSKLNYTNTGDGENVYLFYNQTLFNQTYSNAYTFFAGFGWFSPATPSMPSEPSLDLGQAFFVQKPGPPRFWFQTYTNQQNLLLIPSQPDHIDIRTLSIRDDNVTLDISNPKGGAYNVQFSTDRLNWSTLATNQHGPLWTGRYFGGRYGYYQLTQP